MADAAEPNLSQSADETPTTEAPRQPCRKKKPRKIDALETKLKPSWELFLQAYCNPKSPSFGHIAESAKAAGLVRKSGYYILNRLRESNNQRAVEIFKQFGFTKAHWVGRLVQAINSDDENGNPSPVAMKGLQMYGLMSGENVTERVAANSVTQVFNAPTMVIVGASDERFRRLEAGAIEAPVLREDGDSDPAK